MIEYELSQRQRKELDRDAQLQIAIPVDPHWRDDPEWVVDRLPELTGREIRDIRTSTVWVGWVHHGDPARPESVATRLGEIVNRDRINGQEVFSVRVVVVTFCDAHQPRTTYPVRWPGTWKRKGENQNAG